MKQKQTIKLVIGAVFCALVFAATWISIPTPLFGNINSGDCIILIGTWVLGEPWAAIPCATGAALCDLINGYSIYAPATIVIKALMVITILLVRKVLSKTHMKKNFVMLISAICAEGIMTACYFIYEATVLGYGYSAALNIPFNLIQGAVNIILAILLYEIIKRTKLLSKYSVK